jgi:hypothetical protein
LGAWPSSATNVFRIPQPVARVKRFSDERHYLIGGCYQRRLKKEIEMRLAIAMILMAVALVPAWGQTCSNDTTHGTYAFVCSGFISPAPNAPQVPFSALGTASASFAGVFTGSAKASIGGTMVNWSVVGTQNLNSNCTGTITYDQKFDGKPAPPININYHVLDSGKEIRGMPVDQGTNIICNLRLISRQE